MPISTEITTATQNYGSRPSYFSTAQLGDYLYFAADDGIHGIELWKLNTQTYETSLVKDILPGLYSAYPYDMTVVGDQIYFGADDGIHGTDVWKTMAPRLGLS